MTILAKMGIKMNKEDGEALKQSVDQTRQLLIDMGTTPKEEGTPRPTPKPVMPGRGRNSI